MRGHFFCGVCTLNLLKVHPEWGYPSPQARHAGLLFSGPAPMLPRLLSGPHRLRQREVTYTCAQRPHFSFLLDNPRHLRARTTCTAMCAGSNEVRLVHLLIAPFTADRLDKSWPEHKPNVNGFETISQECFLRGVERLGKAPQNPESAAELLAANFCRRASSGPASTNPESVEQPLGRPPSPNARGCTFKSAEMACKLKGHQTPNQQAFEPFLQSIDPTELVFLRVLDYV